jgi:glycosyltransferase involved in cell wall biosynthesis
MIPIKKHIVIIGLVWPEPTSSAAGGRMLQLIKLFKEWDWDITFCSTANTSVYQANLSKWVKKQVSVALNDSSFDEWIKEQQPNYVLFDRYITEEQFGWRVAENCPTAVRILDTEDLHCLRYARGEALQKKLPFNANELILSEYAKREIASIYRCDLSLMVSNYEIELLESLFQLPTSLLHYLPLFYSQEEIGIPYPAFEDRNNCVFIGNYLHQPNLDAAQWLCSELWPQVRQKFPFAELHIYGAYMPKRIEQLNSAKKGVFVKGRAKDVITTLQSYRINVAPLRFGAGIKGKLLDALIAGTPSITTSIGSEAMGDKGYWSNLIAHDATTFVSIFERLYQQPDEWNDAVVKGKELLTTYFDKDIFAINLRQRILDLEDGIMEHRQRNFVGAMLQHHHLQSTRYFSKWIELKNEKKV